MLQRVSRRRIARLAADIDLLDERLLKIVAGDAALAHRYRLLTSMPGVGAVLACAAPLHKRCASLDVHKVEVVACCLISKRKAEREVRVQDLRSQLGQLRSIDDNNGCSKGLGSNSFTGSRAYQPDFHLRYSPLASPSAGDAITVEVDPRKVLSSGSGSAGIVVPSGLATTWLNTPRAR
jgi:hypothetical protein